MVWIESVEVDFEAVMEQSILSSRVVHHLGNLVIRQIPEILLVLRKCAESATFSISQVIEFAWWHQIFYFSAETDRCEYNQSFSICRDSSFPMILYLNFIGRSPFDPS